MTHVTFAWEPLPPFPASADASDEGAHVALTALAPTGGRCFADAFLSEPRRHAGGEPRKRRSPMPRQPTFEVPPGQIELRMTVESAGGRSSTPRDARSRCRTSSAPHVTFGTPRVFRAGPRRSSRRSRRTRSAIPTTDREFSRTDRLLDPRRCVRARGRRSRRHRRLLNRAGQKMSDLTVHRRRQPAEHRDRLASLARGGRISDRAEREARGGRRAGAGGLQSQMTRTAARPQLSVKG